MSEPASDETIADRRLHPATVALRFVKDLPSTALGLPAAFAFISDQGLWSVVAFAAGLLVLAILFNYLLWRRFRYGVGARDIVIESGLLNRTRRSIPFDRVQDVDIERGPLHRMFGLAKVRIETGGAAKDEGLLDSLTLAEADLLREAIRAGRRGEPVPGIDAVAPPADASRIVFAMDVPRALLSGLFNFSLLYLAGIFAVLQTFDKWLPFDIYDPGRWIGLVDERIGGGLTVSAVSFLLGVAMLLGVVTGVVRTVARDYGFRLSAEATRFRRERGLFTRSEIVLPKQRIQLALQRTGPIRRALGWFELLFQTLSASKEGGGHQSVAPFARPCEVAAIVAETGRFVIPEPSSLTMVSKGHIIRKLILNVVPPLVIILAIAIFVPLALLLLLVLPLFGAKALIERRFHRYALAGGLLFVQRGVWRQHLWIVPVENAQTFSIQRSWLQRRLRLASVLIDTAGASSFSDPRIVDLKHAHALDLVAQLSAYSGRKSGTDK